MTGFLENVPALMANLSRDRNAGSIRTRRSLIERVKDWDDRASWADFFDIYTPLLLNVARRSGLSEADADDVVQDTLLTVAKKIRDFEYDRDRGSFKNWLLQLTRSRIVDKWRREKRHVEQIDRLDHQPEGSPGLLDEVADATEKPFHEIWEEQWEMDLLDAAMERVKEKAKPRQYQIFHCIAVKGWTPAATANFLQINLANVYFARRKLEKMVREEVQRLEQAEGY